MTVHGNIVHSVFCCVGGCSCEERRFCYRCVTFYGNIKQGEAVHWEPSVCLFMGTGKILFWKLTCLCEHRTFCFVCVIVHGNIHSLFNVWLFMEQIGSYPSWEQELLRL